MFIVGKMYARSSNFVGSVLSPTPIYSEPKGPISTKLAFSEKGYIPTTGCFVLLDQKEIRTESTAATCQYVLSSEGMTGWCSLHPDSWVEMI
jgi:hypothetical protein